MLPSSHFTLPKHSTLFGSARSHVNCPSSTFRMLSTTSSSASSWTAHTRYAGRISEIAHINASVVQGSGLSPSSFDVVVSDLHPLHQANSIVKYADDTYLIVPASARSTVSAELEHISSWASLNNL